MKIFCLLMALILNHPLWAKSWKDVAVITASNLEGHKYLYENGFFLITSTKNTLNYFEENTLQSSKTVWVRLSRELSENSSAFKNNLNENPKHAKAFYHETIEFREELLKKLEFAKKNVIDSEMKIAKDYKDIAWKNLVTGHISIKKRSTEELDAIKSLGSNFFSSLKNDFSNLEELLSRFKIEKSKEADTIGWSESFLKGRNEFNKEYEKSSHSDNTLTALPKILWGHFKAIYFSVITPTSKTVVTGASKGAELLFKGVEKLVFMPLVSSVIVAGRVLYSIGGVAYHTQKIGLHILSPVAESSLHASVSLIALASTVPSYVFFEGINLFSQTAVTAGAVILPASAVIGNTATDSSIYAGKALYNSTSALGKIIYDTTSSALVLGYNAITALPAHLVMGAVNSTFFLVYDGPKIYLAWLDGDFDIPVGTVLDLEKMKEEKKYLKTYQLNEDEMKKVLDGLQMDLGE